MEKFNLLIGLCAGLAQIGEVIGKIWAKVFAGDGRISQAFNLHAAVQWNPPSDPLTNGGLVNPELFCKGNLGLPRLRQKFSECHGFK